MAVPLPIHMQSVDEGVTDQAIARFHLSYGDQVQDSPVILDDVGKITLPSTGSLAGANDLKLTTGTLGTLKLDTDIVEFGKNSLSSVFMKFKSSLADGQFAWSGVGPHFLFNDAILMFDDKKIGIGQATNFIHRPANNEIKLANPTTAIDLTANLITLTATTINLVGAAQVSGSAMVLADGSVPLTADWDNITRRIRNTGVAEVTAGVEPTTPVTGLVWLDTAATGTGGSGLFTVDSFTSDITLTTSHTIVYCDAIAGPIVVTLPDASSNANRFYAIVKVDSSVNTVTIKTIGGSDAVLTVEDEAVPVLSNGTDWQIPF